MNQTQDRQSARTDPVDAVLDIYSPRVFRVFHSYLEGYFARNFDGVRVLSGAQTKWDSDRGMVFFCNHASWWDPILIMLLAGTLTPGRRAFGPMEENMLKKYAFMKRVGVFGVDRTSLRGAAKFLSVGRGLMQHGDAALWLTPQGRFTDIRERPLAFESGLGHLARDCDVPFVPFCVEYVFWNERKPELLINFGDPIQGGGDATTEDWTARLEAALTATMDELAPAAMARDPERFDLLIKGRARVNPFYDGWRYLKAMVRREKFSAAHEDDR